MTWYLLIIWVIGGEPAKMAVDLKTTDKAVCQEASNELRKAFILNGIPHTVSCIPVKET